MSDKMVYFPLFVDLNEKQILVFGGGKIATRRIISLLDFGGTIRVVAPECTNEILELSTQKLLTQEKRCYRQGEIQQPYMVIAATNNPNINHQIYYEGKQKGILVNIVSDQKKSDFFFPGLAMEDSIVIGVTASGTDHKKAKRITEQIKEILKGEK